MKPSKDHHEEDSENSSNTASLHSEDYESKNCSQNLPNTVSIRKSKTQQTSSKNLQNRQQTSQTELSNSFRVHKIHIPQIFQSIEQKEQKYQPLPKSSQKNQQEKPITKNDDKIFTIEQKLKTKHRIKRFNLQQNPSLLEKPKPRQSSSASKVKPKLGTGQLPPQKSILLTTWNVNGIRFSVSKNHLSYYINQTKPDILCLTQTKMDEYSYLKEPIDVFGFNGYWNFCKCSSGYSGVVVFSKFEPIRVVEGIPQNIDWEFDDQIFDFGEDFDKEGRILTLEFKDFFLVTAYIPSAGKQLQRLNYKCKQFQPRFFAFCEKLMKIKPTIIAGDLNTALTELDTHITKNTIKGPAFTIMERQNLQGFITNNKLIDSYRFKNPTKKQFTWWHIKYFGREYAIGKRLDYFLLPQELKEDIISCEIKEKFKGSDHSPVQLRLGLGKIIEKK